MPTTRLSDDALEVRLRPWEKVAGLLPDLRVPLSAVREVEVVDDALSAPHGVRAPGLALPGIVKTGTWRGRRDGSGRQYVAVRRGVPALRLLLDGQRWASAVVSTPDAAQLAARLRRS